MLTTIILTCYKQEKFIEETILSVVNQGYKNRELLIGDDSPDNNCRNIISKYVKEYPDKIKAWHHNPNKGIVNNMQFLIEQKDTKSKYIAFLEGDDCLFPEYLEKKLNIFDKNHNIKLVYNDLTTIDENGKTISMGSLKQQNVDFCKKGKISYNMLISKPYYSSRSSLMVKAEVFNNYGIYSEVLGDKTIISDIYFFNQIAHNEDIYGIEEPLVYYRIHRDSVSQSIYSSIYLYLEMIKYISYLFEQGLIKSSYYKNQICRYCIIIALVSLKKSFGVSKYITLKMFNLGCVNTFKYRFRRGVDRVKYVFKR